VIVHERDEPFWSSRYILRAVAENWREEGCRVEVLSGTERFVEADVAILHVDLTTVPRAYADLARRYPRVVNGRVLDISKRAFSTHIVTRRDGYQGPVIVKTNRNSGGVPERVRSRSAGILAGRLCGLPWYVTGCLDPTAYPIFDSPKAVPSSVFWDPRFVVQRFLPEREGELYRLRRWTFLGDREVHTLSTSREPIIKSGNTLQRTPLGAVPEEIREVRRRLGFDYGKFDYAIVGEPILYDVNRTPTSGIADPAQRRALNRDLAQGLRVFLEAGPAPTVPVGMGAAPRIP
jgi:hypothetical protein